MNCVSWEKRPKSLFLHFRNNTKWQMALIMVLLQMCGFSQISVCGELLLVMEERTLQKFNFTVGWQTLYTEL